MTLGVQGLGGDWGHPRGNDKNCKNEPGRLKGQAAAELLCLELLGWVVLPVAAAEWVAAGAGRAGGVQRLKAVTS
jgi:hypothetical protein